MVLSPTLNSLSQMVASGAGEHHGAVRSSGTTERNGKASDPCWPKGEKTDRKGQSRDPDSYSPFMMVEE